MQRQSTLYAGRLAPVDRLEQAEGDQLQQAANQQSLLREQGALLRERLGLEAELQQLPLKEAAELAETDRSIAALEQELAEAEARREIVLVAPQDGTVTAIAVEPGGGVNTATPLLSIVPAHSELQAQLFGPSRAMGFVRPSQRVTLRYEAFPYQKFGHAEGVVASISRFAISPAELPQQLSGLTSLCGANAPVYRITVTLPRQTVSAYGGAMPLQPGMQLEADVLTERRRLIEWVLEPLFTLTGSWHR